MGADPVVSAVSIASAWRAQHQPKTPLIHGFLVRKAEKAHGTGRRIEGFLEKDAPVLIVDDVCTTGASTITAIEAAREAGMKVIAAVCLVEREEAQGRAALEAALNAGAPSEPGSRKEHARPFLRLYTANDVRAAHVRQLSPA
jgi:orotate phosphoribosyltransferase